ncbi:energy-coupling factor ABC transporter ATP-binding protein [Paenibacillus protaetiae]|uniref:energy-coupling factor ABC transporter ATP-binding protein n=1 Tax=Paenibacillus protaetiae TaxID=2509456 RepID=UPI0013EC6908|nr:ATP-binding cassette domain-containing protein [Paenibacillus protaetiae]
MENFFLNPYLIELVNVSAVQPSPEGRPFRLRNIHLSIKRGEWITVLGRNGSGKSTLVRLLAGARFAAAEGKLIRDPMLHIDGRPIPIVMQHPEASVIGTTPWEDMMLMLEQHGYPGERIAEAAEDAFRQTGLSEIQHHPVETLSGGQKQLTAIASCLAAQAPLLLLDEPTANLDPDASKLVLERVKAANREGMAVVWVTQRLDELREGDRVVAMNNGEVYFDGSAERFFERSSDSGPSATSVCEQLGFPAPYVIETAWELEAQGIRLDPLPLTAEALVEAVIRNG